MIDWTAVEPTEADNDFITWIMDRAMISPEFMGDPDRMTLRMDLEVAHFDIPLDLPRLLDFKEYDFWHDIVGIRSHLNRDSGVLENCFLPRCSIPVT